MTEDLSGLFEEIDAILMNESAAALREEIDREKGEIPPASREMLALIDALISQLRTVANHPDSGSDTGAEQLNLNMGDPAEDGGETEVERGSQGGAGLSPDSPEVNQLYDDVLWLFSVNDFEAALISLERLMIMSHPEGEVASFVELNASKLLNLYESLIGPFDKIPSQKPNGAVGLSAMLGYAPLATTLALVDGQRSITDIIAASEQGALQTSGVLNQLNRAGFISLQ